MKSPFAKLDKDLEHLEVLSAAAQDLLDQLPIIGPGLSVLRHQALLRLSRRRCNLGRKARSSSTPTDLPRSWDRRRAPRGPGWRSWEFQPAWWFPPLVQPPKKELFGSSKVRTRVLHARIAIGVPSRLPAEGCDWKALIPKGKRFL